MRLYSLVLYLPVSHTHWSRSCLTPVSLSFFSCWCGIRKKPHQLELRDVYLLVTPIICVVDWAYVGRPIVLPLTTLRILFWGVCTKKITINKSVHCPKVEFTECNAIQLLPRTIYNISLLHNILETRNRKGLAWQSEKSYLICNKLIAN